MDIELVKNFMRVDTDADDEYIKLLMQVAKEYIEDAVGICDEDNARVKLLMLNIITTLYENRQFTIDKKNDKVAYTLKSIMNQLALGGEE